MRKKSKLVFFFLLILMCCACAQRRSARQRRGIEGAANLIKLMEAGEFQEAAMKMERFLSRPKASRKDSSKTMRNLAICYTALERWKDAKDTYNWLALNDKKNEIAWRELARIVAEPKTGLKTEHLPLQINSADGEIMPVISPDGKTLYFIVDNAGNQDIYISSIDGNGKWTDRRTIGPPLNTEFSDGILSAMPDGNTVLLNGIYRANGTRDAGFSISHNLGDAWSFPEKVEIDDYYNRNRYTSACLASNGKTLILALERDEGYGDLDLYVCFRKDNGKFSEPKNLGSIINTDGTDGTPFLAPDGVTLYFSSDGHPSLGNADMFFARRLDDTWTNWSFPKNLGKELNTVGWDAYYTIPAAGKYVYYVSSGKDAIGATDIFKLELPEEAQPKPVVTIEGTITDETGDFVSANIRYERLSDGENLGIATSNPKTGYYSIVLPAGKNYGFSIHKKGFLFHSDHIDLTDVDAFETLRENIVLKPVKSGAQIILKNIFFEFNSAELQRESIGELRRILKIMQENPQIKVEIAGHTDSIGTSVYNKKLSTERAQAVAAWLVDNGIGEDKITAKGYGETMPVANNDTDEGRAKNRRVTFTVLGRE